MGRIQVHTGFWSEYLKERDNLEDPGVGGSIMLRRIFRKLDWVLDWIDLAQDRDRWRAIVNAIMNLYIP